MGIINTRLTKKELESLKDYKYSSNDLSPISKYILAPYWNWAVTLFPLWMAPNLITLFGLAFIVINFVTALIYIPDLAQPAPSWVYYSFAAGIWLYSTFDNVDGKQARRTKSSSPLGELFDHGCDALTVVMIGVIQLAGLGLGTGFWYFSLNVVAITSFYFCTWETYETGSLNLGYINGPTEGILLTCIVLCISGYCGPQFWHMTLSDFGVTCWPFHLIAQSWTLMDCLIGMVYLGFVLYQLPSSLVSVFRDNQQRRVRTPLSIHFLRILPIVFYSGSYIMWVTGPYSSAWKAHPYLISATLSIVFGRMATKIILAHVTKSPFPHPTVMLLPLGFGAYAAHFMPSFADLELGFLWCYFGFSVFAYVVWAHSVISDFCGYLKIHCLTISYSSASSKKKL